MLQPHAIIIIIMHSHATVTHPHQHAHSHATVMLQLHILIIIHTQSCSMTYLTCTWPNFTYDVSGTYTPCSMPVMHRCPMPLTRVTRVTTPPHAPDQSDHDAKIPTYLS